MELKFRALRADEVECRVARVTEKGVQLLLYKDARCDQNILDETVGAMNWQRQHTRENANCIVSIWDDQKNQWIQKEDTGTESNTEKEKGLASDSFKRACTNWGIGRELYTKIFIWVDAGMCQKHRDTGRKDKFGKPVFECKDKFTVTKLGVENKIIKNLEISVANKVVFKYGTEMKICCDRCGRPIQGIKKGEKEYQPEEAKEMLGGLCIACWRERKEGEDGAQD